MSMLHDVTGTVPRYKKPHRKGRGRSQGQGKTAGRGTKGAGARSGKYIRRGYEGGQTEIFRRFPKRGFSNYQFERKYYVVNLSQLERFDSGASVDAAMLIEAGLIPDTKLPVKILGNGEFTKKLTIVAGWYSKSAHEKLTGLGGTANNTKGETFEFPKPKKKFVKRDAPKPLGKKKQAEADAAAVDAPAPDAPAAS